MDCGFPLVEEILASGSLTQKWDKGYNVAKRLNAQRYKKSVGKLKEKYIILLDEIGMNWEKPLRG